MRFLHGNGERTGKRKKIDGMKTLRFFFLLIFVCFACNGQTVYVTKTGEKYHTESCRYLKYSKIEIELEHAKNLGYEACLVCKPSDNGTDSHTTETPAASKSITPPSKNSTASQCRGTTKAGSRCKRRTTSSNGRCYQH